jgi:hypothetical protein
VYKAATLTTKTKPEASFAKDRQARAECFSESVRLPA